LLLDWSFGLLSPEEQLLLKGFSVFVRGWTVEAAIEMAAAFGYGPELAVDLLTGLVNKSLVSVSPGMLPPRYQLLETVREYASEQLRKASEEQRARRAHLALVVRMCEAARADMVGGRMRERIEQLIHEHGNINAAIEYALGPDQHQAAALRIVGALALYLKARGIQSEGYHWCRLVIDKGGGLETLERGRSLLALGLVALHAGDDQVHWALLEAARIARLHGDVWTEGYANGYCAMWLSNTGRPHEAVAHAVIIERIAAELADPLLVGLAGLTRGWIHLAQGDGAAAITVLRPVSHLSGDLHQRHFISMYIGLALFGLGDHVAAAAQFLEALRGAAEVGNVRGMAGSIEACGYILAQRGSTSEATRLLAAARGIRERTEIPLFSFWLPHHEAVHALLRVRLGSLEYEAQTAAGMQMREEDAANEARLRLQRFSRGENNPPGS
jgi:non-specific serine/threonine protein kinase